MKLIDWLLEERKQKINDGLYRQMQVMMAYHSNKMEGSTCSYETTELLFDTSSIPNNVNQNDGFEMFQHFRAFDAVLDSYDQPLSESYIKGLHLILKNFSTDQENGYAVGEYKTRKNRVGLISTSLPDEVPVHMARLLDEYLSKNKIDLKELLDFHVRFEKIHPFQDGNGRVGRLIMMKECLHYSIPPFIITEENSLSYKTNLYACQNPEKYPNGKKDFLQFIQNEQNAFEKLIQRFKKRKRGALE